MSAIECPQSRCRAGVAWSDITPPVGMYHRMWGAALHDRSTGVHRPLLATLLWLEPVASAGRQLLIALDHCMLDVTEVRSIQNAVARAVSLEPVQIHVTLSHSHAAGLLSRSRADLPGGDRIGPYLDGLTQQLCELARDASNDVRPTSIVYGAGRCNLAAHRDAWDDERDHSVCGLNAAGPTDDTVLVARLTDDAGRTTATIVNYACHPTTLAWENTLISPDFVGAMREVVETTTRAPCLFLQGASGDLGPREGFVGDVSVADRNGRQLGFAALSALEALPPAGTRYGYAGPVVSGAVLGTWRHEALDAASLQRHAQWECRRWQVDLPYRHDLPSLEESRQKRDVWLAEEDAARAVGDVAKVRDCRARVEQMTRQLGRLTGLPGGKAFPYPVTLLRLGDAVWILSPGELYHTFQTTLRRRFPQHPLIVATHTGGWQPGYIPTASTWGYGIYQETIAAVAPGSLELLIEDVARQMATCVGGKGRLATQAGSG